MAASKSSHPDPSDASSPETPSLFDPPGTPSADKKKKGEGPILNDHTADRGYGAPNPRTAREAVRDDAVRHGSADPDSVWTRRRIAGSKRARLEHSARDAGQPEMFEVVPGSRLVAAKLMDPFAAFQVNYDKWIRDQRAAFSGVQERTLKLYCRNHGIDVMSTLIEQADENTPRVPGWRVSVARCGYRFTAIDPDGLVFALDRLADTVRRGPEAGVVVSEHQPIMPAALRRAWETSPTPALDKARAALRHFTIRMETFGIFRDKHVPFTLTERDLAIGESIGVPRPTETPADPSRYFITVQKYLVVATEEAMDGLTKAPLPGEQIERVQAQVAALPRVEAATPDPNARAGGPARGTPSVT